MSTAASALPPAAQAGQLSNAQATSLLTSKALTMIQNIFAGTVYPPANPVIQNLTPRNVGIIKKFVVEIVGTITNTDGADTLTLTDTGLANLLSNTVRLL